MKEEQGCVLTPICLASPPLMLPKRNVKIIETSALNSGLKEVLGTLAVMRNL